MSPERFEEVEELYHAVREREPSQRSAFLAGACGGDEELRREVESLLAQDPAREGMLDRPAAGLVEDATGPTLDVGVLLGPYRIEAPIGAGGMGEVYRAIDTRLGRAVALKTSREKFSGRFEREARAIAALNHLHICTLYDVGPNYLVMELVEGETLAARLKRGKLSIHLALQYGSQIADALAAAHAKGIIHRDLKPGNIMLTKSGVKVLDFGLAKSPDDGTLTVTNAVMGTPAYMAPEQREGKECDARTDIYALGLVLREMAPDPPPDVARVVERCLAPEPENRWHSAKDVQFELEVGPPPPPTPLTTSRATLTGVVMASAVVLAAAAMWTVSHFRQPPSGERVVKLQLEPPQGVRFVFEANVGGIALSPDGKIAAYVASTNGKNLLWVQPLDGAAVARPLPGTEDAGHPFWSPDSRALAFFSGTVGRLQRVDIGGGGVPLTICDVPTGRGGVWGSDGQIIFGALGAGLFRVPATGGTPVPITTLDASRGETAHRWPQLIPGGHILYWIQADKPENTGVYASSISKPNERSRLLTTDANALYAPGGDGKSYLLWLRSGTATIMAQELDVSALKLAGEARPIAGPVASLGVSTQMDASASASGLLLYSTSNTVSQFTWLDRKGNRQAVVGEPGEWNFWRLSRDGRRAAVSRNQAGGSDLWILETERGVSSRFTFRPGVSIWPVWSPDQRTIVFSSAAPRNMFRKEITGAGTEQRINESSNTQWATDWSGDGHFVLYQENAPGTQIDLWILLVAPDGRPAPGTNPRPYLRTPFNEWMGRFSPEPNPRWVAYQSDESGRYEVYVDGFPEPHGKTRISTGGGYFPQWGAQVGKNGRELFYISPDNKLMSVNLALAGGSVEPSAPRELFALPTVDAASSDASTYEVAPDGNRFLVRGTPQQSSPPLTVIVNWPGLLKKGAAGP